MIVGDKINGTRWVGSSLKEVEQDLVLWPRCGALEVLDVAVFFEEVSSLSKLVTLPVCAADQQANSNKPLSLR